MAALARRSPAPARAARRGRARVRRGAAVGACATSSRSPSTISSTAAVRVGLVPGLAGSGGRGRRAPRRERASGPANCWLGRAARKSGQGPSCPVVAGRPNGRTLPPETPRTDALNAEVRPRVPSPGMAYRELAPAPIRTWRACGSTTRGAAPTPSACCRTHAWTSSGTDGRLVVAGPATGPVLATVPAGAAAVGVRFRVGAAGAALALPAAGAARRHRAARSRVGTRRRADRRPRGDRAARRGAQARHARARSRRPDRAPRRARRGRARSRARRPPDRAAGIGDRQLRRRFAEAVGYGPKTLQRVLRFQRFLALAARARRPTSPGSRSTRATPIRRT